MHLKRKDGVKYFNFFLNYLNKNKNKLIITRRPSILYEILLTFYKSKTIKFYINVILIHIKLL